MGHKARAASVPFLVFLLFSFIGLAVNALKLEQVTNPIIFGENATLLCSTTELNAHGRFAWRLESVLLSSGNVSSYPKKYTPTVLITSTGVNSSLEIIGFDRSDLNKVYKCEIGFQDINISLSLNKDGFISKPSIAKMETETDKCIFRSISLVLKNAFPRPICEIFYTGENYTEDLNTITLEDGSFFNTRLEIQKLPCEYNCRGNITLTCLLGNITYTIIDQEYLCIQEVEIPMSSLILVNVILGIAVVILVWADFRYEWNRYL